MNLEELADAELGPGVHEGRAEFLESCREIGRAFRVDEATARSIVGSLYWLAVPRQRETSRWGDRIFGRPRWGTPTAWRLFGAGDRAEPLVVAHGDPVRFSLVLLDPDFETTRRPLTLEIPPEIAVEAIEDELGYYSFHPRLPIPQIFGDLLRVLSPSSRTVVPFALVDLFRRAVLSYARMQPGGVLVVRQPRLVRTSSPIPAAPVRTSRGTTSTAGMLFEAPTHELLITAANHAVTDDTVEVAGVAADVIGRHEGTDSCVLRVPYTSDCPLFARVRELRHLQVQGLPPRPHEGASFVGVTSGPVETTIRAHDPSILFRMPEFASKLYTDCDTVDGDSGAALYDSGGKVIGFAAYRTAYGEDPSYSVWIWAKQVIEQHKLDRL
ncbi:hypothetical protein [Actinophytocola sp.]|uniref:hypothetical protein n=1 Tax=Actinophytocola sp. TaxID=1872138 RepID=UPI00389AD770